MATTPTCIPSPQPSPHKRTLSLSTAKKFKLTAQLELIDNRCHSTSPKSLSGEGAPEGEGNPKELRTKFVGEVDLLESKEPLLQEIKCCFVLFPIQYPEMYKKAEASFWTAKEMDLSKDLHDWNNHTNDNKCHFISHVFTSFAASDSIINESLVDK
ncbi:hypothetical protein D9758_006185 [Tetrapyrgos nigripes]|uniref:Uncharacterized protein n=1 Tax=Tetrapyrgos nigripes TaxID=182062 RepID=A0A8H5GAQ3_9AGAR|nr:hypothetical protein D9758_006185 [Tetrapyrgos nigripes]